MTSRIPLLLSLFIPITAQGNVQSALHPKGEGASQIAEITWILFIGGALIFIAVMVLTGIALFGTAKQRDALARYRLVIGGGIIFPVAVLSALLVYSFSSGAVQAPGEQPAARIEVTGELWWWRVRYHDAAGSLLFETANEIRIPANVPVELLLKSSDVIHSFWVPNLAGKIDMIPGHVNRLRVRADAPGTFRGQCAEYCGAQHAKMAFYVIAQTPQEYNAWRNAQMQPAREPRDALLQQGRQVFFDNRCGQCHVLRGTLAGGKLGPDLTHFGSRTALAAGVLPNNPGTVAGWIAGSQQIKPGNRMPSFHQFSGGELRALAAYLHSLQ